MTWSPENQIVLQNQLKAGQDRTRKQTDIQLCLTRVGLSVLGNGRKDESLVVTSTIGSQRSASTV